MGEWVNGRRDYGNGWIGTAWTDEDGMWFDLDTAVWNASIGPRLRGTPADCDLMHACIVALRERPEALRALLERPAVPAGRTAPERTAREYIWVTANKGALVEMGYIGDRPDAKVETVEHYAEKARRNGQRLSVVGFDLPLAPEDPPTVEGRVEVGS